MRRFAHYIKPNSRSESPRHILCFDTETKPHVRPDGSIRHRLWFGWWCYLRSDGPTAWRHPQWGRFSSALSFWRDITSLPAERTTLYVFCHNTNFDLPVVKSFKTLRKLGWKLSRAVIDAPPTIITLRKGTRKIVLLDTLNWWRVPLSELGASVGQAKLPMPAPDAAREVWDTYCRGDVEVLCKALTAWLDLLRAEDLGGFAMTLASQAMRTWRHKFMPVQVLIDTNDNALSLSRTAYLGGRNECFQLGPIAARVHCVDINSMYPAVMRGRLYPTRLIGFDATRPQATFIKFRATCATVGKVLLRTEEGMYPRIIADRLCFPVGTFWAHLAGPELMYAFEHGQVVKFESLAVYHQSELFTEFVDYFYQMRLAAKAAGNSLLTFFYKILMNSLYGKFGQRGRVWEEGGTARDDTSRAWVEYDVTTGVLHRYRQLAGLLQVKSDAGEAAESMPAIAAYVTSYARMELNRLIRVAEARNCYYCDTDSLFVNDDGYANLAGLLHPDRLGAPKEEWTTTELHLRGLKDYSVGAKVKIKGVRKNATWLSDSELVQDGWSGLRGQLRNEDLDNAYTRPVRKHLSRQYSKGLVRRDGRIEPLRLSES